MAGVSLGGLSSGLDTQSIIDQLMAIDRAPETRMKLQQSALQARQQTLTDIGTRLRNLSDTVKDLGSTVTWANTQSLEVSDSTKLTATRLSGAAPGGHEITSPSLARSEQRSYAYTASDSTLTIGSAHDRAQRLGRRQRRRRQDQLERRLARLRGLRPGPARRHDEGPSRPHPQGHGRVQPETDMAVSGADWTSTEAYTAGVNAKFTVDGGAAAGEQEQRRQERRPRPAAHVQEHRDRRRSPSAPRRPTRPRSRTRSRRSSTSTTRRSTSSAPSSPRSASRTRRRDTDARKGALFGDSAAHGRCSRSCAAR